MEETPIPNTEPEPAGVPGDVRAQMHETHTGIVFLIGDRAYKAKKPVVTDFLDFSTPDLRERACAHETMLNRRLAPDSYLGVAHFTSPEGGPAEPVIVMRRYSDAHRLASMVQADVPVEQYLVAIADTLARFHGAAMRGPAIDACGSLDAVNGRWQQNLTELGRYVDSVLPGESVSETQRLATQFIGGRSALFAQRIAERRIIDGHADLLADDIFCLAEGPAVLDCLEFDDQLRYIDGIDDAAFLAMDLEFLGRKDLANAFLHQYRRFADDDAPAALADFYIAYRAVVRAKVDCIRFSQGRADAVAHAQRHMDIALDHLRAGTVRLVVVGGGPGTGKTTLARGLADRLAAQVISTDDVRRELQQAGSIGGETGVLDSGLYTADNVATVYDEVLRRARHQLCGGRSVVLDGTWRDQYQRDRARRIAGESDAPIIEFTCAVPLAEASARIEQRKNTTSDATPQIAAALTGNDHGGPASHEINTARPEADSVAEAEQICHQATLRASR